MEKEDKMMLMRKKRKKSIIRVPGFEGNEGIARDGAYRTCSNCGFARIEKDHKFCIMCGKELGDDDK